MSRCPRDRRFSPSDAGELPPSGISGVSRGVAAAGSGAAAGDPVASGGFTVSGCLSRQNGRSSQRDRPLPCPGAVQPGERGGCVVPWVGLVMGISYLPSFSTTSIRVRVDRRSSEYLCTSDSYAGEIAIDHAKGYTLEKEREFRWPDGNTSSKAMAVARRWPSTEAKDIHYWEERDSLDSAAAPSV